MAAKKNSSKSTAKKSLAKGKGKSTSVRHTPIPQINPEFVLPAGQPALSHDLIARRAYKIWQHRGGSEYDNWTAAESELRAALRRTRRAIPSRIRESPTVAI